MFKKQLIITAFYFITVTLLMWLLMRFVYLFQSYKLLYWMIPTLYAIAGYVIFLLVKNRFAKDIIKIFTTGFALWNIVSVALIPCDPSMRISMPLIAVIVIANACLPLLLYLKRNSYTSHINNYLSLFLVLICLFSCYFYTLSIFMIYEYTLGTFLKQPFDKLRVTASLLLNFKNITI
jgi:hypothetical protein